MEELNNTRTNNRALVIGGGVGGIKAALDLAEAGRDVVLIDKAFSIGGLMTQLDRTFPTNNCDLCTLSPHLAESGRQLHIDLLTLTQLVRVEGEAGRFRVGLKQAPRYIDMTKCTACGDCLKQFPECVRFTPGLDHRAPTCMRYPQATPYAFSIDMEKCGDVDALVRVCRSGAIVPEDEEKKLEMEVGAIVLAPGAEVFAPGQLDVYGHGAYPNVVSGLEYERILSASGPTLGELVRPSDGKQPRKIAWIQCVGSRSFNPGGVSYCSSACCMYALKEAIVTKERVQGDIETVVFYMDMRTSGKDYELYYQRAKDELGIRFVRSRPHTVEPHGEGGDLAIVYSTEQSAMPQEEVFDMVVLSTGFRISDEVQQLGEVLGIELNEHHFARTASFAPVSTSRPGIYVCGLFESPKDIPETMVQASAAACMAAKDLPVREAGEEEDADFQPERDVALEDPKIGVFVCDCGYNIGGVVEVDRIVEYARKLPQVAVAEGVGHGCSRESLDHIQETILEKGLNRVVIGGCSPRTHETLFQDTVRKAGLNRYLVEIANIRDQDTWVHADRPVEALDKAKDMIRMAVASVALTHPLKDHVLPMNQDILVVGGGVAGMSASLSLADQGFKVYLVERSDQLGGIARNIRRTLTGEDVQAYVTELIKKTTDHPNIQVLTRALIVDHTGMPGFFKTGLQVGARMFYRQISHGVTILATGALANRPGEYLLGEHGAVMTQLDLDGLIEEDPARVKAFRRVAMIQCVGSRCPENPNCSRICCQSAIKNALRIRALNPEAEIFVLYRDMRTYGFQEDYYRRAREQGVRFFRYDPERRPEVRDRGDQVSLVFHDPILDREIETPLDCLALSTGMVADEEATE
ncbi:MAG: CoB--CoM heterodisulfide reductase iron-sulfur subunit A family protein, partial [Deltaproteobacteria bacterium]|nr:CoB--CoM heterodisulfide reductase iron-sulfur subunit A family protein [Deltaproteobacteria bacterium]